MKRACNAAMVLATVDRDTEDIIITKAVIGAEHHVHELHQHLYVKYPHVRKLGPEEKEVVKELTGEL